MMTLGEKIETLRIKSNKTLRQFCLENKLDASLISKIERNKILLSAEQISIFEKIYDEKLESYPQIVENDFSINKLPAFINSKNGPLNDEKLDRLIDMIRNS